MRKQYKGPFTAILLKDQITVWNEGPSTRNILAKLVDGEVVSIDIILSTKTGWEADESKWQKLPSDHKDVAMKINLPFAQIGQLPVVQITGSWVHVSVPDKTARLFQDEDEACEISFTDWVEARSKPAVVKGEASGLTDAIARAIAR